MSALLPIPVRYVPYQHVGKHPHLIVDGAPLESTALTLSHWPNNQTPAVVLRDTSTATVFAYLDSPELHVELSTVSNNHFDEDGLFSMFALCHPDIALVHRDLLIGGSLAGDFGVYEHDDALRLCFTIESFSAPGLSPLPQDTFSGCDRMQVESLSRQMLERLPPILADLNAYEPLWAEQYAHVQDSAELIASGVVKVDEHAKTDLAVVLIPEDLPPRTVRRYLEAESAAVHPFAIHNVTHCNRILRMTGRQYELQYRYESWVQLASYRPALRVALDQLATHLNQIEAAAGIWCAENVNEVAPRLYFEGADASSIAPDQFVSEVNSYLSSAPVAWDPYDWDGGR